MTCLLITTFQTCSFHQPPIPRTSWSNLRLNTLCKPQDMLLVFQQTFSLSSPGSEPAAHSLAARVRLCLWRPVLLAVDLCDPGPQCCCRQPKDFLLLRAGEEQEGGRSSCPRSTAKWLEGHHRAGKPCLRIMVTPVCFLPIDCQQSRVYTLCVRMPCREGSARLAPCARVAGGSRSRL